jgi:hypothetical protein
VIGTFRDALAPSGSRAAATGLAMGAARASDRFESAAGFISGSVKLVLVGRTSPSSSLSGPSRIRSFSRRNARTRSLCDWARSFSCPACRAAPSPELRLTGGCVCQPITTIHGRVFVPAFYYCAVGHEAIVCCSTEKLFTATKGPAGGSTTKGTKNSTSSI